MPSWVPPPPLELQLWYGDLLVAELHQVFPHQGTWFAPYELKIAQGRERYRTTCLNTSRSARTLIAGLRTGSPTTSPSLTNSTRLRTPDHGRLGSPVAVRSQWPEECGLLMVRRAGSTRKRHLRQKVPPTRSGHASLRKPAIICRGDAANGTLIKAEEKRSGRFRVSPFVSHEQLRNAGTARSPS